MEFSCCFNLSNNTAVAFLYIGTTFVTAEDVYCKGGHGFSVGSLGKGADFNVVSDISMTRMTCEDCWAVAQIKVCEINNW